MGTNRQGSRKLNNGKRKKDSDEVHNNDAKTDVRNLKEKNTVEILKRIEEAETASDSSEDSPFVSDSDEDEGVLRVFEISLWEQN